MEWWKGGCTKMGMDGGMKRWIAGGIEGWWLVSGEFREVCPVAVMASVNRFVGYANEPS